MAENINPGNFNDPNLNPCNDLPPLVNDRNEDPPVPLCGDDGEPNLNRVHDSDLGWLEDECERDGIGHDAT